MKTSSRHENPPVVLCSSSPRRIQLLSQLGISIHIEKPEIQEFRLKKETAKQMVSRLSREKTLAVLPRVSEIFEHCVLVAADTTVVAPNGKTVLEKPKNEKDALRMLTSLQGKTHIVHTGYTIVHLNPQSKKKMKPHTRVVTSKVKMRSVDKKLLKRYIETKDPMDKAGAYGLQGLGGFLVESVTGSPTNVIGLPLSQVTQDLERFGVFPFCQPDLL